MAVLQWRSSNGGPPMVVLKLWSFNDDPLVTINPSIAILQWRSFNYDPSTVILQFQILSERGYIVKERGLIQVKGKGEMLTFYVLGRKISRSWRFGRTVSLQGNNSLAEVVYGMVRARKRRKTTKGNQVISESVCFSSNAHIINLLKMVSVKN